MTRACSGARLRITRSDEGERGTTLRLEGRLDGSDWDSLAAARAECAGRSVVIDLSGLAYLAREEARRLVALRRQGVGVRGGSGFVRELLRSAEESA